MTAPRTPEQAHDALHRYNCVLMDAASCPTLAALRSMAEVSREERAAEFRRGFDACDKEHDQADDALDELHRNQIAAAEKRGEERVRRALNVARGMNHIADGPVHPWCIVAGGVKMTTHFQHEAPKSFWWALTGEGEPPQEKS